MWPWVWKGVAHEKRLSKDYHVIRSAETRARRGWVRGARARARRGWVRGEGEQGRSGREGGRAIGMVWLWVWLTRSRKDYPKARRDRDK